MTQNLLTKSRFKLALECPAKLYYVDKKEYANQSLEDTFLEALAEGGFQIGELAKCYYKNVKDENDNIIFAEEIKERDYKISVEKTNKLLQNENVIIFEAAFRYKDLFVRTDVLEKKGNKLRILEVKAKSYDPNDPKGGFLKKNKKFIKTGWIPYIYDIAFQKYVVQKSLKENKNVPSFEIKSYLMLADKSAVAPTDGLNQKFLVKRNEEDKPVVEVLADLNEKELQNKLLIEVSVDEYLKLIYESEEGKAYLGEIARGFIKIKKNQTPKIEFKKFIDIISKDFKQDKKIKSPVGKKCKSCEFYADKKDKKNENKKSGFEECWKEKVKFRKKDFEKQLVYEVWNYRNSDNKFEEKLYFIDDLKKDDFKITEKIENKILSVNERQWLQVEKYKKNDNSPYIYLEGLKKEMNSWKYPLHFIDFETTSVAIPFNVGIRPYEGVAFQYSHHIVNEDGKIEHKGQYINDKRGEFPSFDFVCSLKDELSQDEGTIFRYAAHENTYLNIIYRQLRDSTDKISDKKELMDWIKSITKPSSSTEEEWESPRNMIDLKDIEVQYYYNPLTNGSNSIKQVLPAVLNSSEFLQKKYSKAIYGAENGIKSLNYKDWIWIKYDDNNNVIDPYKLLPPVFDNETDEKLNNEEMIEKIYKNSTIHGGGDAMMAYAKMQFTQMSDSERKKLKEALLKYCELDTFAMVLIWEYWNDLIK